MTHAGEREAFLRAVIASPDDDCPRLVYADWLDEHGEPARAEFIRVQCELARMPAAVVAKVRGLKAELESQDYGGTLSDSYGPDDFDAMELVDREWELLTPYNRDAEWFDPPVPSGAWTVRPVVVFRRGFVEHVTCAAADWLAHGHAIRADHPVTRVTLTTDPATAADGLNPVENAVALYPGGEARLGVVGAVFAANHPGTLRARTALFKDLFAAEFPGVAFELPPAVSWDERPDIRADVAAVRASALAEAARPLEPRDYVPEELRTAIDVFLDYADTHLNAR